MLKPQTTTYLSARQHINSDLEEPTMDADTWILLIIGVLIGIILYLFSNKHTDSTYYDELDDWDQQDQLEGDQA